MVVTKLFFASSVQMHITERAELSEFFISLNNSFVGKGLYFAPVFHTQGGDDLTAGGSLVDALSEIAGSSLAFFLFNPEYGGERGEALQEMLKIARDEYIKTGRPAIVVYTRTQGTQGDRTVPLCSNVPLCYTNTYSHIDTLKLGILMQIKQLGFDGFDIRLKDGKAWQGGEALLALDNVDSIARYENLQQLKEKRFEIESRFFAARARYLENPDSEDAYEEFFEMSKQRGDAMQQIRDMETQLYNVMEGLYEHTSTGKLSKRQVESYRLIERGLLNEARDMLDFYAIMSESRHDGEVADKTAKRALVHIQELLQLKDVNAALCDWESVDECYKEAVRLEEKYHLPRKASVGYVLHLISQWKYDEAVELGEKLRHYYQSLEPGSSDEDLSFILNQLGGVYGDLQNIKKPKKLSINHFR